MCEDVVRHFILVHIGFFRDHQRRSKKAHSAVNTLVTRAESAGSVT